MKRKIELYVHIPFCVKKCAYCDFPSGPASATVRENYLNALKEEIKFWGRTLLDVSISTIFIGGGTPSLLDGEQMQSLLNLVRECFDVEQDAEITMEMNPGTVDREKLLLYKKAGINRVSIGLQSAEEKELQILGRIHTFEQFLHTYKEVRECGFTNVNVDLMSALPGQTKESFEKTLRTVADLGPEHLSVYSLIVEEGTPFFELYGEGKEKETELPTEEEEREMYRATKEILQKYGYTRYEISNYAKPGFYCRHNLGYWERKEYLGVGVSAASLLGNIRFANIRNVQTYISRVQRGAFKELAEGREILDTDQEMEEFMFLGLRMQKGVSFQTFEETFHVPMKQIYGKEIEKLKKENLLKEIDGNLRLTEFGIDISNYVFVEFMRK